MINFSLVVRYELWNMGLPKLNWEEYIREWLKCSNRRANEVLLNDSEVISEEELGRVSLALGKSKEDLLLLDPLHDLNARMLILNLNYLIASNVGHGGKQIVAKRLGVEPGTVSRWLSGTRTPSREDLTEIAKCFSVDLTLDLTVTPLFLSYHYFGYLEMQQWLKQKSDTINRELLVSLFPALRRLLE
ncbi:hypothetical protein GCM10028895_47720 [Pontibacter rugosus]